MQTVRLNPISPVSILDQDSSRLSSQLSLQRLARRVVQYSPTFCAAALEVDRPRTKTSAAGPKISCEGPVSSLGLAIGNDIAFVRAGSSRRGCKTIETLAKQVAMDMRFLVIASYLSADARRALARVPLRGQIAPSARKSVEILVTWASLAAAAICSAVDTLLHIRFHQEHSQLAAAADLGLPAYHLKGPEQSVWGRFRSASGD